MFSDLSSDRIPSAVVRAAGHWDALHREQAARSQEERGLTIAVSRQTGTLGEDVAQAVGRQLDWPVFDHELLEQMANAMNVRVDLLETVDERHQSWLLESIEALAPKSTVSETSYLRYLVETICSLAAHGNCVIVGRGAAQFLPTASTLRVRIVAPMAHRIETVRKQRQMTHREAERYVTTRERQRLTFVKEHFQKDASQPDQYDLTLNTQHCKPENCAELIVAAAKLRDACVQHNQPRVLTTAGH
mgnify:CR=1 FL=1